MSHYSLAELLDDTIGQRIMFRSFDATTINVDYGEISFLWTGQGQHIKVLRQDNDQEPIYSEDEDIHWPDADGNVEDFDRLINDWLAENCLLHATCKNSGCSIKQRLGDDLICPNCKTPHWESGNRVFKMQWSPEMMCGHSGDGGAAGQPSVTNTELDPPKLFGYKLTQRGSNPDGSMDERNIGICTYHYNELLSINYFTGEHKCWPLRTISRYQEDNGVFMVEYAGQGGVYCTCCYHKSLDILNLAWPTFANFLAATGGNASSFYLRDVETLNPQWASVYRDLDRLFWEQGRKGYREIDAFLRHYTVMAYCYG